MSNLRWLALITVCAWGCGGHATTVSGGKEPASAAPGAGGRGLGGQSANGGEESSRAGSATSMGGAPSNQGGAQSQGGAPPSQGGAPPSQGGAAASQGGAPPDDPCRGIQPRCHSGEPVCDPVRGTLTTCSACGEPMPGAGQEKCVRVIASDKESNGLCVVRGATELQCWGGWGTPQMGAVPEATVEVLLPDDFATFFPLHAPVPCVRTAATSFSCMNGASCARTVAGDEGVCSLCGAALQCTGRIPQPPLASEPVVDLAITDNSVFLLTGAALYRPYLPRLALDFWRGSPQRLRVDHQSSGCVSSDLGEVACWSDVDQRLIASPWVGPFRKLIPTTIPEVCVLGDDGRVSCGNVFLDEAPKPLAATNAVDMVASATLVCALSVAGHVSCWKSGVPLELPEGW